MTAWNTIIGPKQECREAFLHGIRSHIQTPTDFFVLPSEDAHDVYMLKSEWPRSRIRGVERDRKVWKTIDETHLDVDTWPMTVNDYVVREAAHPTKFFDAAFLDFVGWMNDVALSDVVAFAEHLSKPRFVLGVTFSKAVRTGRDLVRDSVLRHSCLQDDDLKAVEDGDTGEWNTAEYMSDAVCGAIDRVMAGKLNKLDILSAINYRANPTSAPMMFMCLYIERA